MSRTVRNGVRYALMTCALSALAGPVVFAQSVPPGSVGNQSQNATTTQLGKVEVTGTRIKRTSIETAQPITIITAAQIRRSGLTTVADVLQNLPQAGASLTEESEIQSTNSAATGINLRYFGGDRVLVLVNGRRWIPGLGGSVDLTAIPSSIIDHIEVLQDGASAIYGSDAITGVVNIITVKNFNGGEAHAYMGMYDNDYGGKSGWDGKTQEYDFTLGSSGQRTGIVVNAEYQENQPVYSQNRAQSVEPVWTQGRGKFNKNSIGFFKIQSPQLAGQTFGEATCSSKGICQMSLKNVPSYDPTLDNFVNSTEDSYDVLNEELFTQPVENSSIYLQGHADIDDNITFTALASYNDRSSWGELYPGPWEAGTSGKYTVNNGTTRWGIGANNPYNPFGVDLVGNASQYCPDGKTLGGVAVPSCTRNYLLSFWEMIPVGIGDRISADDVYSTTFRMGLNGFFDALGSEWDWDLGYNFGRNYDSSHNTGFTDNVLLATQLDSPGFPQCNGPAQSSPGATGTWQEINGKYYQILQPGCVPVNPFGGYNAATNQGTITPEMGAYNLIDEHDVTIENMRDYVADITGTLAQMPAGPLSGAAGVEYLEMDGSFDPGPIQARGDVTRRGTLPTNGRILTHAEYFEFNIPLLAGVPLAKSLSIDLANRWSQFSWAGTSSTNSNLQIKNGAHASTGRAQIRWQPNTDLLLRGSWAQGFRTPSITNLFNLGGGSFDLLHDPCAPEATNGGWNPATPLPPGCNGLVHSQPDPRISTTVGGNSNLTPEHSISRSFGFVYSPSWLPGFDLGADYYNIDLGNTIGSAGANFILDQCYLIDNPQFCHLITLSGNSITNVADVDTNIGETYSNGIDVNADYTFPSTSIGNFRISTNWTFVRSFITVVPNTSSPTGFESIEQAGYSTDEIPKTRGAVAINWNSGNWSAVWNIQYIGYVYEACTALTIDMNECSEPNSFDENTQTMGKNRLGTTIYHDVDVTYHVNPINADFTLGVRNLFNKQYPAALFDTLNSFLPSMGYRVPGRFFYARVGVKF